MEHIEIIDINGDISMNQIKERKKDIGLCLLLVILFFILLRLTLPEEVIYGSQTDWLSQHVSIAESLRDEMLNQGTLFLDFIWLGGGSNAYNFSYYGYLRPDVILGCILNDVPMEKILVTVMLSSFLITILLCYAWLRMNKMSLGPSFLGAFFCMTTSCFFHFHRQIMFVNYMPLLFLALILTHRVLKKRSILLLCLILSGICFQSYYYSISCFLVICIYWLQMTRKREDLFFLLKTLILSIGLAAILLLPTFLALLENKRTSVESDVLALFVPNIQLEGLLYSPYGIGFSIIILYLLLEGIIHKQYRKGSVLYLCLFVFPIIPYLLNGTLYARYKILMPFLPLILLHAMKVLQGIWNGEMKPSSRLAFVILCINIMLCLEEKNEYFKLVFLFSVLDMFLILVFSWLWKWKNKAIVYVLLLIAPMIGMVVISNKEEFVLENQDKDTFTERELRLLADEEWARLDFIRQPLMNANQIRYLNQKTTSMYSSVTNKKYAEFYYDIMHTPIRINNRVALLPEVNPFLQNMMGVRYIVTNEDKIPYGYQEIKEKNGNILAENENVMPLAYLSTKVVERDKFDELFFPYTLEVLSQYTVVESVLNDGIEPEEDVKEGAKEAKKDIKKDEWRTFLKDTRMKKRKLRFEVLEQPKNLYWKKKKDGVKIEVTRDTKTVLQLEESLDNWIGIVSFDVINESKDPVVITMNGTRNKLSGRSAPYPNENNRFTFYLDEGMEERLEIELEKGKYCIDNLQYYVFPRIQLIKKDLKEVSFHPTKRNQVLDCYVNSEEDSYFVTSIPYQHGMEVYVDGERRSVELVNTAFVGTVLEKGLHEVEVRFVPPGKRFGYIISTLSVIAILWIEFRRKFQVKENH